MCATGKSKSGHLWVVRMQITVDDSRRTTFNQLLVDNISRAAASAAVTEVFQGKLICV